MTPQASLQRSMPSTDARIASLAPLPYDNANAGLRKDYSFINALYNHQQVWDCLHFFLLLLDDYDRRACTLAAFCLCMACMWSMRPGHLALWSPAAGSKQVALASEPEEAVGIAVQPGAHTVCLCC